MAPGDEETTVKALLSDFVRESIPDYILDGSHAIVASDGIQKLVVNRHGDFYDVEGQVQGDDFQVYTSELSVNLKEGNVSFFCNCPDSFSGVCRHVGATALKSIRTLEERTGETAEEAPTSRSEWRQTFRTYFSSEPEPEPGRHYLIFRFHPEPGRLQVAFFSGPAEQVRYFPGPHRDHPGTDHQESGLVRTLAHPAGGGRDALPPSGLRRPPGGDPARTFGLVLLGHQQGILPVLARHRTARAHRVQDHASAAVPEAGR